MESETSAPAALDPPSTSKPDEPDPRASLRHVLADPSPSPPSQTFPVKYLASHPPAGNRTQTPPPQPSTASATTPVSLALPDAATTLDSQGIPGSQGSQGPPNLAAITYTLRKNANGGVSTVYSGSKIKYLKKDDGLPFWRRDIQFSFLRHVFQDQTRAFTKISDGSGDHTFAEVYVDSMANSSKCSQILKEKLLGDTSPQALDMAMICLLVNVGRMNTTVNFFPEMRARVRTFHSIPCLQTHQNPQAYKQLQDGPRLKSILKGAMEDTPQPNNLEEIANHAKPRMNPVSLIFVLAQYAPRISDLHFPVGTDFFDLFMRDTLSSRSRAKALLWIVWWYLESDFTAQNAQQNPFGQGRPSNASDAMLEGLNVMKGVEMRVPEFENLTEDEAASENVDAPDEIEYGETKKLEREVVLTNDHAQPVYSHTQKRNIPNYPDYKLPWGPFDDPWMPSHGEREPQQNHSHRNYSSSPTRSGDTRGRLTPRSDHPAARDEHVSRSRLTDRDRTQSRTPAPTTEPNTSNGASYSQQGKDITEGEARKGPGRGNYPRRIKAWSTQSFEQMHHPDHFKGTGAAPSSHPVYQLDSEQRPRVVLPSNDGSHGATSQNAHHQAPSISHHAQNGRSTYQSPLTPHSVTTAPTPAPAEQPATTTEQAPSTKRSRQTAERHRAVEQTRNDRVANIIDGNISAIREAKRRERKRRGVIVDAWIKARALPEFYDSEDEADSFERYGGMDDVRNNGGIDVTIAISMALGIETKKMHWNPGDIGEQAGRYAKAWRKLARLNGVEEIVERNRRRTRGAERDRERSDNDDDAANLDGDLIDDPDDAEHLPSGAGRRHSPLSYPTSNFAHKNATLAPAGTSKGSPGGTADDDAATVTAEPTPKRRRRTAVRRSKGAAAASKTANDDDERLAQAKAPRGGRKAATATTSSTRATRKRRSTADSTSVATPPAAAATAAAASPKEPKGATSQPGSVAWFIDTGEKMEAERRGKQPKGQDKDDNNDIDNDVDKIKGKGKDKAKGKDKGKETGEPEDVEMADDEAGEVDAVDKREADGDLLLADVDADADANAVVDANDA